MMSAMKLFAMFNIVNEMYLIRLIIDSPIAAARACAIDVAAMCRQ